MDCQQTYNTHRDDRERTADGGCAVSERQYRREFVFQNSKFSSILKVTFSGCTEWFLIHNYGYNTDLGIQRQLIGSGSRWTRFAPYMGKTCCANWPEWYNASSVSWATCSCCLCTSSFATARCCLWPNCSTSTATEEQQRTGISIAGSSCQQSISGLID
jgi:hypothetical protein